MSVRVREDGDPTPYSEPYEILPLLGGRARIVRTDGPWSHSEFW